MRDVSEKKVIEISEKCPECKGTGLYRGIAEGPGAAVVCRMCEGTGCHEFRHSYEDFTGRVDSNEVEWVYECNPGIMVGKASNQGYRKFGGMSVEEWKAGKPFGVGTENRECTCPAWWFQNADYKRKPDWKECRMVVGRTFSSCPRFAFKQKCWERFDREEEEE